MNRSYLEDVARRLVALDTVSARSNVGAIELLADELERAGARVRLQSYEVDGVSKANLAASVGPAVEGGLILSGHVDTVPFDGQPGWQREPLQLEVTEERVYGRGTSDMKVFLAQCLDAVRRIEPGGLSRPLVLLFTADEEVGCAGAKRLVRGLPDLLGDVPVPKLAWIGEPTSFEVFHAHKGIAVFDICVHGRGGHSSRPDLGVNAITVMGRVLEELRAFQDEGGVVDPELAALFAEAPRVTLNVGTIRGGTATNVIAEECRAAVSFRFLPGEDPLAFHAALTHRLRALDARDARDGRHRADIAVGPLHAIPAMLSSRGTPLEQSLFAVLGRERSSGALFSTDGCRFASLGIQSLVCGPGDLEEAHQPNESISRVAFERGADVILAVVEQLCGAAS